MVISGLQANEFHERKPVRAVLQQRDPTRQGNRVLPATSAAT